MVLKREHSGRLDEIDRRFLICYTGEPRLSGINNWEMFKRHINGDREKFEIFDRIRDAAEQMRDALLANDWCAVGEIMRAAYPNRKRLAPNITTPQMDAIVEKALANGAEGAKVCGAGGGGCIAFLCGEGRKAGCRPRPGDRSGRRSVELESVARRIDCLRSLTEREGALR